MTPNTTDQVTCANNRCRYAFGSYPTGMEPEGERQPCPGCGGLSRKSRKSLIAKVIMRSTLEYGAFPPGPMSTRRRFAWGMTGWDFSDSLDRLVRKVSHFDRRQNRRLEHVEDPETGDVLHHQDHPLTEHRGHGSDKFRNEAQDE
jgi:hypothetical protein